MGDLPKYEQPPVVEVAMGVQFRPIFGLRGLALAPLRDRWQADYPKLQEQPELAPTIEGSPAQIPQFRFNVVQVPPARQWFLNDTGTMVVQVQQDRLLVNWRTGAPPTEYPRYRTLRRTFKERFDDLAAFVAGQNLGELDVTQAELSYINVIEEPPDQHGQLGRFLKAWSGTGGHHLGDPEQARLTLTFLVPDIGQPPVRLYAEVNPAQGPNGQRVLFFTLTVRGNPGGKSLEESLKFMDEARDHLVRSFTELTTETMQQVWGRIR